MTKYPSPLMNQTKAQIPILQMCRVRLLKTDKQTKQPKDLPTWSSQSIWVNSSSTNGKVCRSLRDPRWLYELLIWVSLVEQTELSIHTTHLRKSLLLSFGHISLYDFLCFILPLPLPHLTLHQITRPTLLCSEREREGQRRGAGREGMRENTREGGREGENKPGI